MWNCRIIKPSKKLLFVLTFLFLITPAFAQEDNTTAYYHAYNICSPAAHYLTRQACNYGIVFEKYYTDCMSQNGYGSESDSSGNNYYEGYMKAYNRCYSSAEQGAQTNCNYRPVYQGHYNACMAKHHFNERGEKIGNGDSDGTDQQDQKEGFQFNF
jgi:hypothetical protein